MPNPGVVKSEMSQVALLLVGLYPSVASG